MEKISGNLRKMSVQSAPVVEYALVLGEHKVPLNPHLGERIQLQFTGRIHCVQCGRKTNKSFQQGYCFPCLQRLAECHFCIIHPEKCGMVDGSCPPDDWAHAHCTQSHIIYLANSSGLKVGITRHTQVPVRWIDQGARQALPIFQVANRYQAGVIEVCLKPFVNDKTDWRKLLKRPADSLDLPAEYARLMTQAQAVVRVAAAAFGAGDLVELAPAPASVAVFDYPVQRYPQKIINLSFDKTPIVSGNLEGIKGQYLLLDTGVINIRKFSGYEVEFSA